MSYRKTLTWGVGLTATTFAAALCVYIFARANPPALIEPFRATVPALAEPSAIFGSAPSLLYTLSIGLLIGIVASTRKKALRHCLLWVVIVCCLEWSQHASIASILAESAADILPGSIWHYLGPYWIRGYFDPLDLVATLLGGAIAFVALTRLPTEHNR